MTDTLHAEFLAWLDAESKGDLMGSIAEGRALLIRLRQLRTVTRATTRRLAEMSEIVEDILAIMCDFMGVCK